MAKFKAEIDDNLKEQLDTLLESNNLTKDDFLKLAIHSGNLIVRKKSALNKAKRAQNRRKPPNTLDTILETNQKLYQVFVSQAEEHKMSLAKYARKLGFALKEVEKIKTDKCILFVPRLKAALLEDKEIIA